MQVYACIILVMIDGILIRNMVLVLAVCGLNYVRPIRTVD